MKSVAIFQHTPIGTPGSVLPILDSLGMAYEVIRIDQGQPVPESPDRYAGLIFMGGYMGVHDPLPWIAQECRLIQQADAADIPVSGHCLGSQLLAVALGGQVAPNVRAEVGWHTINVDQDPTAHEWFGHKPGTELLTFQWHSDTFSIPENGLRIATNDNCRNQAFVVRDLHLGMQSHFEMTPSLVADYVERNGAFLKRQIEQGNPAVSSEADLFTQVNERTLQLKDTLSQVYGRWVQGCKL
jgi:GMP synthase-like glutamine amidotransferase